MSVILFLSAAMLCFGGQCHPALVGQNTPTGSYTVVKGSITAPGYPSGKFASFARLPSGVPLGIHPTYTNDPAQHREWRLHHDDPELRVISNGCINVDEVVYDQLPNVFELVIY